MPGGVKPNATDVNAAIAGTFHRDVDSSSDWDLVKDTEVEIPTVSDNIVANGSDKYFRWIRIWFWAQGGAGIQVPLEYVLMRCKSTDALIDLNSAAEFELAQKQSRILAHGWYFVNEGQYVAAKLLSLNKYKIQLYDGEELRLVFRPAYSAVDTIYEAVVQWRELEQ